MSILLLLIESLCGRFIFVKKIQYCTQELNNLTHKQWSPVLVTRVLVAKATTTIVPTTTMSTSPITPLAAPEATVTN